jgi:hypothetical protein
MALAPRPIARKLAATLHYMRCDTTVARAAFGRDHFRTNAV